MDGLQYRVYGRSPSRTIAPRQQSTHHCTVTDLARHPSKPPRRAPHARVARGERVRKHNGKATQARYVYDEAGHILVEQTISGSTTTTSEIVWMDDLPVGVIRNNTLYYIEPDHLGTPRQVIDRVRNVAVWRWDLINDPFGESAPNPNPDGDATQFVFNLRFPGQLFDAESALNYNYFRDYEPGTGRYVESDPIGLMGGISSYAYVESTPILMVDPLGLRGCPPGTYKHPIWGCQPNPTPHPTPRKPSQWSIPTCYGTVAPLGNCEPLPLPVPEFTCAQKCNFVVGLACGPIASFAGDTSEAIQAWIICKALVYEACKKKCENSCE